MRYDDPTLHTILAGEYALGTLHGRAKRRFERLVEQDLSLRQEVDSWEAIFATLVEALPDGEPSERVWQSIAERTRESSASPVRGVWHNIRFWRGGAILAAACALLLAVALGVQLTRPPVIQYVAVVADSQDRGAWLITAEPQRAILDVQTLRNQDLAADHSFELWLLPRDGSAPRSMGLLSADGKMSRTLPQPLVDSLPVGLGLAVSVEPQGGSPTGQPTGPVLYQGLLLRF